MEWIKMYNNFYIHKKKLLKIGAYCMILVLVRQFCFSGFLSNINLKKKKGIWWKGKVMGRWKLKSKFNLQVEAVFLNGGRGRVQVFTWECARVHAPAQVFDSLYHRPATVSGVRGWSLLIIGRSLAVLNKSKQQNEYIFFIIVHRWDNLCN